MRAVAMTSAQSHPNWVIVTFVAEADGSLVVACLNYQTLLEYNVVGIVDAPVTIENIRENAKDAIVWECTLGAEGEPIEGGAVSPAVFLDIIDRSRVSAVTRSGCVYAIDFITGSILHRATCEDGTGPIIAACCEANTDEASVLYITTSPLALVRCKF